MSESMPSRTTSRAVRRWTAVLGVIILVPCAFGFTTKFAEFVATYRKDELGVFAIMPIFNYLLASVGFGLLFFWSISRGMFKDLESPKYAMLERERWLDEENEDEDNGPDDRGPDDDSPSGGPGGDWNESSTHSKEEASRNRSAKELVYHG
ncbi:MAG: cbb3-type cytochrome oxidase assembly protein [Planctomycetota bacterium]